MAIIYSYPLNDDIKLLDELVGTTEKSINGQLKTVTRNFLLSDLAEFFIVDGGLQKEITLTTNNSTGPATLNQVTGILNIPRYDIGNITSISAITPITATTGATPVISTSMSTNKLIGRYSTGTGVFEEITLGTGLSFTDNVLNSTALVTPAALTKIDDTNVTLTLGGSPSNALLQGVSLTLGWAGTLEDSRITSSLNWNTAYNNRITSLTTTGSGAATLVSNTLNIPTVGVVSATTSGIVNNISLQELGGVDKKINGIRIGRGNISDPLSENTAVGYLALQSVIHNSGDQGYYNTAVGDEALKSLTTGNSNDAFGDWTLRFCTTGTFNTAIGGGALHLLQGGSYNTAIGPSALRNNLNGSRNTAVGTSALQNNTGSNNTAIGSVAGGATASSGSSNILIGFQAGRDVSTGTNNLLIENITNGSITSGSYNIILNPKQKSGVTTGSYNTIIGAFDGTFPSAMANNVILADGQGNIRFRTTGTGLTTAPGQTNILIDGDATGKAVVTKEYLTNVVGSQNLQQVTNIGATTTNSITANSFIKIGGLATEYLMADGTTTTGSGGDFVPYIGATSDVNLGEFGIQLGNLEFDNTPTNIPTAAGSMYYNDSDGTVDLILKGGNVTLQIGQETVIRVVNKTATNISLLESNYQAVRITGAQGQRPKVDLAQATNDELSAETIGLVTETIVNNQEGFITTSGLVRGINTTGSLQGETWLDGDILYLSPTVAGSITKVKPAAPNHLIIIGYVIHAHITQGTIFVKVDNGYELGELHNVKINGVANNNVLAYTSSTSIWENKTVETALGYTPANDASVVHLAGTEIITGAKTLSSQTILGDGVVGTPTYGLLPQATVGSTTGGVFDIRNTNTNIIAGNTIGTLQFSAKDDDSVAYSTAQIKAITQNGIGTGGSGKTDLIFYTSNGSSSIERVKMNDLGLVINSEVTSTIASFDSNKSIKSLTTADGYPSLVELKHVKGVTSAIQTQLNAKANDANVVHLTGNETIAGEKTFSSNIRLPVSLANTSATVVYGNPSSGELFIGFDTVGPTALEMQYVKGVTSAIQTQLDGKVDENTAITGATKTKITYDSKGLVTAGADIATTDISDFNSATRAQVEAELVAGTNITITPSGTGATRQLTIAATGGTSTSASGAYSETPIWSSSAPTTLLANNFEWVEQNNLVTLRINLSYSTGASNANVRLPLPTGSPTPKNITGFTGASNVMCFGSGLLFTDIDILPISAGRSCFLRRNAANNGFEIVVQHSAAITAKSVSLTISYFK